MDTFALTKLLRILKNRIYDPGKYVKREKDELLTDWQVRSLGSAFTVVQIKNKDGKEVLVMMVEGLDEEN